MRNNILLAILILMLCFMSMVVTIGIGMEDGIDYRIRLDQTHGVIINNDTVQLDQLEEYIIQDNL